MTLQHYVFCTFLFELKIFMLLLLILLFTYLLLQKHLIYILNIYYLLVSSTNIGTLGNMTKGGCENKSALFILLSFIQKMHKILTYHWSKTIESGEKISWWNKCFHYFMLATIIGTQLLQRPFPG